MQVNDNPGFTQKWTLTKYKNNADFYLAKPYEKVEFTKNIMLNEGITEALKLIGGITATAFSEANSYLAVGNAETPTAITGTSVTFTNASATVTGVGTSFDTQLAVGDVVRLDADDVFAEVTSIESATSLTLTAVYSGTGGTGSGSFIDAPVATSTDLLGSSKTYKAIETGYPTVVAQTITWRAIFGSTDANHRWLEFSVANGSTGAAVNLNRRVSDQGTKASGQTWTLDLAITMS